MLALTDRMSVIDRPKMLHYADSMYYAQKNKSHFLEAGHFMAYSNYYDLTNVPKKSLLYTDSAIAIIDKENLSDSSWARYYFAAHIKKANVFFKTGDYPQAIEGYLKIKELADKPDNKCGIGVKLYNNIGLILFRQQKYEGAKNYFKQALGILDSCSVNLNIANKVAVKQELLDNIGESFINQGNIDSALVYYRRALYIIESGKFSPDPLQDKISRSVSRGVVLSNIAQIFVKENKLDSAEIFFRENIAINAISYKNEIKNAQQSQLYLADLYNKKKEYPKMKAVLADLRKGLDTIQNSEVELGWRKLMAEYDNNNNLPREELIYYKSYVSLKDSIDRLKLAINQSDFNKELEAKRQQINYVVLQKDNQLSHLYLWITIVISIMAVTIVALIYYYYRKGKRNIRTLTLLNREVGEQKEKIEFAMVELEKSNKDKARILRVVAHDLRDPIGGAATLVNTVINEDLPEDYEKQNLNLVEKTLINSLGLINSLVEFDLAGERIQLDKEWTDINEILKHCAALMQLIAEKKGQRLHFTALQKPLPILIDKERTARMVNNLIGNAIKFSKAGQAIYIELELRVKTILISVKDNGIGIPPEMQDEIFNTLGGTRRVGTAGEKSFGLGLSICRQIVEAHGGKIWVQSEPEKGAVFFVELPL
ncbi:tetratricopeptide repeat-containing sensor histidine kinase [Mucilaginibacter gotjawali]|uniref:Signal transduction histidine kinase n=2 Tax=Mucilaginibacter gotjawali TaxID=1550579 RepID=A0A839SLM3_9SPHI|nr:tetratricopeptide repeat-containing sensor histidine kinase [Mucilaginibacter gotjawali]MBB3059185.1 signal transduction histidine kinase [Mucilaginibacter gotjawali]BAU54939.1 Aerobic respiration control sensor protein ArcB [Mucilaginibacter gotjawali]